MTRVVCVGDVMVDVLAHLPGELAIGSDTPAPIALLGGGSAANTAAWLAQAGTETVFVGRVGDDVLGRLARDELTRVGVGLAVSVDPVRPTGTCIVLVDATGERTMVPAAGANSGLGDGPLPAGLLQPGDHLHVSAYALFNDGSRPAVEQLTTTARGLELGMSVDAASSAPLASFGADRFVAWFRGLGAGALLFANREEAEVLVGRHDSDAALARALGTPDQAVIVKCGAAGAVWSDGNRVVQVAAVARSAIDSTGAGDAFAAGVLTALLADQPIEQALAAGNALAAAAISRPGARP
jgi:sugar/nucleoside kinase (ribokinase family)